MSWVLFVVFGILERMKQSPCLHAAHLPLGKTGSDMCCEEKFKQPYVEPDGYSRQKSQKKASLRRCHLRNLQMKRVNHLNI